MEYSTDIKEAGLNIECLLQAFRVDFGQCKSVKFWFRDMLIYPSGGLWSLKCKSRNFFSEQLLF